MNRKFVIGAVVLGAAAALISNKSLFSKLPLGPLSQETPLDSSLIVTPAAITGRPQVLITTTKGNFVIETRPDLAPKTVTNFLARWNSDYCNGKTFHRVEDWVVQGCDPKGDGTGGQTTLPTETSSVSFSTGSIGVARKTDNKDLSNDSQFFIVKKDSPFLDGEYTYFGSVVSGMDTVTRLSPGDKILSTSVLTK